MKMPWERNDGLKKGAEKFGTPVSKAKEENRNISARLNAGAEYKGYVFHGTGNGTTAIERGDYPGGQTVMTVNGGAEEAKAWIDKNPLPPLRKNTGEVNNAAKASACPACKKPGQKIIDSEGGRVARADGWECSCGNMWATDPKTGAVQNGVGGEAAVRLNAANIEAAAQSGSSSGGGVDSSATGYQQTEKTTTDDGKLKENGNADWDKNAKDADALQRQIEALLAKKDDASFKQAKELMKQKQALMDKLYTTKSLGNASDEDFKSKCAACNSLSKEPWSGKCGNCLANYDGEENGEKRNAKSNAPGAKYWKYKAGNGRWDTVEAADKSEALSKAKAEAKERGWGDVAAVEYSDGGWQDRDNDIPPPQGEPWDQESYNGKDQGERVNSAAGDRFDKHVEGCAICQKACSRGDYSFCRKGDDLYKAKYHEYDNGKDQGERENADSGAHGNCLECGHNVQTDHTATSSDMKCKEPGCGCTKGTTIKNTNPDPNHKCYGCHNPKVGDRVRDSSGEMGYGVIQEINGDRAEVRFGNRFGSTPMRLTELELVSGGERKNSDTPYKPIAEDAGKTGESIRGVENGEKWTPVEVKDSPKIADGWYPKSSVDGIDDRDWFASRAECEAECERMNEHGLSSKERKNAGHLAAEPWSVASDDERMGWLLSAGQDADLARFEWADISMDAQKALQDVWDMPASRNEPGADPEGADGRGQTTPVQDRNFADEPVIRADMSRDGEVVNAKGDACPSCGSNETFEFKGAHGDNMACSICDRTWGATRKNASDTEEKLKKAGFAWTTSGSGDAYIIYRAGRDPQASMVADSKISLEDAAKKVLKNASDKGPFDRPNKLGCNGCDAIKPPLNKDGYCKECAAQQGPKENATGFGTERCKGCKVKLTEDNLGRGQFCERCTEKGLANSITGTELTLKLKGRRNAGVAAGEAKYGSRENAGDGKWHLDWGGAGQPACGKTTQDGFRVAKDGKDVDCPKCLDIAERNRY